jgi:DNA-binding response OmpR family regulator
MAKILVIEDAKELAKMLSFLLSAHLHEIELAYTPADALTKIILFEPQLVLMDVFLGDENGRELCKTIRKFNKKVPIMLMSASADVLENHEECQANDSIEKPFSTDILMGKINRLIGNDKEV